jgi:hypothetical protein
MTQKLNELHFTPLPKTASELECAQWLVEDDNEEGTIQPVLTIAQAMSLKKNTDENMINHYISNPYFPQYFGGKSSSQSQASIDHLLEQNFQETCTLEELDSAFLSTFPTCSISESGSKTVEILPRKTLNISVALDSSQEEQLIQVLREYSDVFAWEYNDMKGIHLDTCIHHIYMQENARPIRKPHRRMNPTLREIVKEELQKLLNVGFIYPISDSQWVSPLVIFPKKDGKWRVCIDYRELNKETLKDYFPLPFIDQVLDTLEGKKYLSFLDGFSGYNQIQIALEDQDKTTFTFPWGTYAYKVLPFGLCNAPTTFQRAVLAIFSDLLHDCMEVYMDDFTMFGNSFEEALTNLKKFLKRCRESNLTLSNKKCFMIMIEGIVLGHHVSAIGIQVDPAKIEVIVSMPPPTSQKGVQSFLGHAGYYRCFIEILQK